MVPTDTLSSPRADPADGLDRPAHRRGSGDDAAGRHPPRHAEACSGKATDVLPRPHEAGGDAPAAPRSASPDTWALPDAFAPAPGRAATGGFAGASAGPADGL